MGWLVARKLNTVTGVLGLTGLLLGIVAGCNRAQYRRDADLEAYRILEQKNEQTVWKLRPGFSIEPHSDSRLADPTDPDDPVLPYAGPNLYDYSFPKDQRSPATLPKSEQPKQESARDDSDSTIQLTSSTIDEIQDPDRIRTGSTPEPADGWVPTQKRTSSQANKSESRQDAQASLVRLALGEGFAPSAQQPKQPAAQKPGEGDQPPSEGTQAKSDEDEIDTLPIQAIPKKFWDALPRQCLPRMLEFGGVRLEYAREFKAAPSADLFDTSRRLTLDDILRLSLLNSREYQSQKEQLYRTALALTLERFDYQTKFSSFGNGTDVNFSHSRIGSNTANTLGLPSSAQVDKMLATGGSVLARFANNILLTFNGPDGFAADVNSELLFNVTQSVFQRDVLLNQLIQSERNVAYSARDFARFRKTFFLQLASEYYNLLRTYRLIEIDSSNYFSLIRAFDQAESEAREDVVGAQPQVRIDQYEQSMLTGRSSLIGRCNDLERSLDRLKLLIGLPTETPINLDLRELERLTLRDEIEVAGERVRRARSSLQEVLRQEPLNRGEMLNAAMRLIDRLTDWLQLQSQIGKQVTDSKVLFESGARLRVDEARIDVRRVLTDLQKAKASKPPASVIFIFMRTMDVIDARLNLTATQFELATLLTVDSAKRADLLKQGADYQKRTDSLRAVELQEATTDQLKKMQSDADQLLEDVGALVKLGDPVIGAPAERPPADEELKQTVTQSNRVLKIVAQVFKDNDAGLVSIDISVDDAMVTALVQRLDLMNERGFLADDWRSIKIAADDLKSMLNLNASQSIRTENGKNRFSDFTFDDSRTQLGLSLDLPLNRQAQRNSYRRALINFRVGQRSLMAFEDNIKFDIRDGRRQLDLAKIQYEISVASAALASDRVLSTRLERFLGLDVQARDFLEAQDAFQRSLTSVANGRIGYIISRARFALDLELMLLNDDGIWPEIRNQQYQPPANFEPPLGADSAYGDIPDFLRVSPEFKRMLKYKPAGTTTPNFNVEQPTRPLPPAPLPPPAPVPVQPAPDMG